MGEIDVQTAIMRAAMTADVPLLLWGPPGSGKTASVLLMAKEAGAHVEILIGSTLDPADVGGMPVPDHATGTLRIAAPDWARRLRSALDAGRQAWLFLDEISTAPPSVQAPLLRVVHGRHVAGIDLHGCRVVAAANRADSAADGGTISAAMGNRWCHVEYSLDPATWIAGELGGWGEPATQEVAAARGSICAFIRRNPTALLAMPPAGKADSDAWPSPRSWSHAALMLGAAGMRSAAAERIVAACVGAPTASEWMMYQTSLSLPDPEDVLAGRAPLPARGDEAYATLAAVVAAALSQHDDRAARIRAAWTVLGKTRPDVALIPAKALLHHAPDVVTPEALRLGNRILGVKEPV